MGTHGALHLREVVENSYFVVACELIAAAQGISLTQALLDNPQLGRGTSEVMAKVREVVSEMDDDRFLHADSEAMLKMMGGNSLITAVRSVCELQW